MDQILLNGTNIIVHDDATPDLDAILYAAEEFITNLAVEGRASNGYYHYRWSPIPHYGAGPSGNATNNNTAIRDRIYRLIDPTLGPPFTTTTIVVTMRYRRAKMNST